MYSQQEMCADGGYGSTAALPFKRTPGRMDGLGFCLSLFFPWMIFSVNFTAMSFELHHSSTPVNLHYSFKISSWIALACVAFFGYIAFRSVKARKNGHQNVEVNWFIFLFATSLFAWFAGIIAGDLNFWQNMQPFYDVMNLNTYPSVDPSKASGQQLMDAGQIIFAQGTKVDLSLSNGLKNLDTYCVAPITIGDEPLSSYDFWAVGLNCCSAATSDFQCGEFNNPNAKGGLRLMDDGQRSFYRLAVQQAEATHKIKANHPLFLYWMQDPHEEIQAYQDAGLKYYMIGVMGYFACELFISWCALIIFRKLG
jgi:hypothetical protein